ncbi:MAG TPA: leucine-rich repeat domain-containing protein, partial [Clostridiaceae bacterium]|nr:leucine-rich repeat domain-containing protein [Clostridiaceae bacterium]
MERKQKWSKLITSVLLVSFILQWAVAPFGVKAEHDTQITSVVDEQTNESTEVSSIETIPTEESEVTAEPNAQSSSMKNERDRQSLSRSNSAFTFEAIEGGYKVTDWTGQTDVPGEVIIPETYENEPVIEIQANVFQRRNLTKVVLPQSLKKIGHSAFADNQIATIEFSKSTPDAVPALTEIGPHAFADNELTSVKLPARVTTIGAVAFGNNKLTTLTMGESVTTIGNSAFRKNNLTAVTLPNSITSFGENVFGDN